MSKKILRRDAMSEIRALTVFDSIPTGCTVLTVADDSCDPHLRVGEFALVDTMDREPQHGELYVIGNKNVYDELRCSIYQVRTTIERDIRYRKWQAWWYGPLVPAALPAKGHSTMEAAMQRPLRMVLTEGPMTVKGIREKIVGRVVGIYEAVHEPLKISGRQPR
jgi:hypothetical protein